MPTSDFDEDRILIVIPVYNHAATLREVVERCLAIHPRVLVVDDGSSDGALETLAGLDVRTLRHDRNRGKGAAILTGAREARRLGMSHIVTIDADGQHDPADFPRFVEAMRQHPLALVVGNRDFSVAHVPGSSRFGRQFSNFWLRVQTGKNLPDTQNGFRAYPLFVLHGLKWQETRYSFEIEVLVKAAWAGVELRDVDISVYYPPATERISHFRGFVDNFRLTLLNTRLTLRSIAPVPHRKLITPEQTMEKVSVLRPLRSLKILLTENSSPFQLAAAGAVGVLLGTVPLIACHTIAILFVSSFFRLNKVAAVTSSQLCMPPIVPALCIEAGYFMRHGEFLTEISMETLGYQGLERVWEWLLGSLILGPAFALVTGVVVYALALLVKRDAGATV
ncbi:MAG: glycosyl transferase family 2 [Desulfuromonadaceae bacterium GWC2_58_13]|nr:MAG: glycosyl transferase family 2 [Desulfuromonadaceae bacterium GWC2_58_13]